MARSKQTARKSTGGGAPRERLAPRTAGNLPGSPPPLTCTFGGLQSQLLIIADHKQAVFCNEWAGFTLSDGIDVKLSKRAAAALSACQLVPECSRELLDLLNGSNQQWTLAHEQCSETQFAVLASHDIAAGRLIGVAAGCLREASEWNKTLGSAENPLHLYSWDVPAGTLKDFGYQGPDLVLECLHKGNLSRMMQDGSWWDADNNIEAYPELVLLQPNNMQTTLPVPLICLQARRDIKAREELLMDWGMECWLPLSKIHVHKQARFTWLKHMYVERLQASLGIPLGLEPEPFSSAGESSSDDDHSALDRPTKLRKAFAFSLQGSGYEDVGAGAGTSSAAITAMAAPSGTALGASAAAMAPAGSRRGTAPKQRKPKVFSEPLSHAELKAAFPGLSEKMDFSSVSDLTQAWDAATAPQQLAGDVQALIDGEPPRPAVHVVEVLHKAHPVRWCTLPRERAFALLAARDFKEDDPIIPYIGQVTTLEDFEESVAAGACQVYGYDIELDKLPGCWRRALNYPDDLLVVNSATHGNESRFVNCPWGTDKEANVGARLVFDGRSKRPFIMLYALRRIAEGEELFCSYGKSYWRIIATELQALHSKEYQRLSARCEGLEARAKAEKGIGDEQLKALLREVEQQLDREDRGEA